MLSYVALKPSKPLLDKNKIPAVNRTGVVSVSVSAPPKKPKISQTSAVDSGNQNAPMRPRSARLKTQETPYPGSDSRTSSRAGRNATTSSNEKPKTKMSAITAAKLKDKEEKEALRNRKFFQYSIKYVKYLVIQHNIVNPKSLGRFIWPK